MERRICTKCNKDFALEKDDLSFYSKMDVSVQKVCPLCRFKIRALWRNETTLYSGRKCGLCNKSIISMYNPKSPYKIYCYDCFYSDKWDPRDYAIEYDHKRSFLEQMREFLISVPKVTTYISNGYGPSINSEYVNMAGGCKNCYLVFNAGPDEEVLYSRGVKDCRDSSDIYFATKIDRCYECINVQDSSGILWGKNVLNSIDSMFVVNCRNVLNCFGCVNLNNKSYHILNEPYPQEEYNKKISVILGSFESVEKFKKEFEEFCLKFPMRENNNIKSVDCTGDYVFNSKNIKDSFEVAKGENCRYIFSSKEIKDSYDCIGYGTSCERLLENVATGHSSNCIACYGLENSVNMLYSFYTNYCTDCVACDALKNGKYCIFNKEYPKEEYEKLRGKIIEELQAQDLFGLMMPPILAPFAYNETIGQDNIPMTKEEVLAMGFRWEDDIQKTEGKDTLKTEDIPDNITDITEDITRHILSCVDCKRNYKIINQEFLFYKKMRIPIPRKCFYCRHKDRIQKRGSTRFDYRKCDLCSKNIYTNYSADYKGIVYCEECFKKEVY